MIEDTAAPTGLFTDDHQITRCVWCRATPEYQHYHDHEWGFPVQDDRRLFEKVCLEGFQAGLSWLTILKKREAFRRGFANFDMDQVAGFGESEIKRLLLDAGIVRHHGKIASTINNAQRAIEIRREFGSLAAYFWRFEPTIDTRPQQITRQTMRSGSACLNSFTPRDKETAGGLNRCRVVHGGVRRLRRTQSRGGQLGAHQGFSF